MNITLIAAKAQNGVIGNGNKLPWNLPKDLEHFKNTTMGHIIVMGRKTYESIGRPLPGRTNIVISSTMNQPIPGVAIFHNVEEALAAIEQMVDNDEVFIIGGAQLYKKCMPYANKMVITEVLDNVFGDTVFPPITGEHWNIVRSRPYRDGTNFCVTATYTRIGNKPSVEDGPQSDDRRHNG